MARVILFAGLLLVCGDLRRTAGAPSLGPAAMSGLPHNSAARHPKEELKLESLKDKVLATAKPAGMKESAVVSKVKPRLAGSSLAANAEISKKVQVPAKAPVNMEHPARSDNYNENSKKNEAKQEKQQASGFEKSSLLPPMEERNTVDKNAGLLDAQQDYTPQDIAEYIFWTGDERRIALALNDVLQDQLVTKEDVVRFLEDVKRELTNLRNRYSAVNQANTLLHSTDEAGFFFDQPQANFIPKQRFFDVPSKKDIIADWNSGNNNYNDGWSTGNSDKTFWSSTPNKIPSLISFPSTSLSSPSASAEENNGVDYEEALEKIREADDKYREFSLEEIIYQLAKELFSQDELQGQPQRSIQRLAHFVENDTDLGRIPKDLSKAVLDTLVAALADAVSEQAKTTATGQQPAALVARGKPRELKQKLEKLKSGIM